MLAIAALLFGTYGPAAEVSLASKIFPRHITNLFLLVNMDGIKLTMQLIKQFQVQKIGPLQKLKILDWFNQIYADLVRNIDNGCVGGAFFEYSDEQEKGDAAERTMVTIIFFSVSHLFREWSTSRSTALQDKAAWIQMYGKSIL